MIDEAARIRALASGLRRDNGGALRIAAPHTPARYTLPPALGRLRAELPKLDLRVQPAEREVALAALGRGEVDAAVVSTSGNTAPSELALACFRWQRVAVVPRGHALARSTRPGLRELAGFPLLAHASALRPQSSLPRLFAANGLQPRVGASALDADSIKAWVRAGLGVGIVAEMTIDAGDDDLAVIALSHLLPACTTWLCLREDRALSAPVEALVAALAPHADRIALRRRLAGDRDADVATLEVPVWQAGTAQAPRSRAALAAVSGFG
jgi:DNA-binding transcriptional LysR family regulator